MACHQKRKREDSGTIYIQIDEDPGLKTNASPNHAERPISRATIAVIALPTLRATTFTNIKPQAVAGRSCHTSQARKQGIEHPLCSIDRSVEIYACTSAPDRKDPWPG